MLADQQLKCKPVSVIGLTDSEGRKLPADTQESGYFRVDEEELAQYFDDDMKPIGSNIKYGEVEHVLVRDQSGNRLWCGWIKLWPYGDWGNHGRAHGRPSPWWGNQPRPWHVGDTIEPSTTDRKGRKTSKRVNPVATENCAN